MNTIRSSFAESILEEATLAWLEGLCYMVKHDPEIALSELFAERNDYDQIVLGLRLPDALARLSHILAGKLLIIDKSN
jgi:hypothetical protein